MPTKTQPQFTTCNPTLHMALELSASRWKLGFADQLARRPRVRSLDAGDFDQLKKEIAAAKKVFRWY